MAKPLASGVIPLYNGERFLAKAIESVLAQTYEPIEIFVVDDGSTDGGADIAKSFDQIQYIHQTNQGQAAAMNAGVKAAQGVFISFLDADDMWTPNKLDVQIAYLLQHPHAGYVMGKTLNFIEPGTQRPARLTKDLLPGVSLLLSLGAIVVRKAIFDQVGYFDTTYKISKDVDWFVRVKENGDVMAIVPETVLHRRIHGLNDSYRTDARTSDHIRVLKSSLDRKRARVLQASRQKK